MTFDCPDPSTTAPARGVTTTPLGALALMNDSFVLRMADHFAERLEREHPDDPEGRMVLAYEAAFGRSPDAGEIAAGRRFAERHGLPAFCRVLFNANEFVHIQ